MLRRLFYKMPHIRPNGEKNSKVQRTGSLEKMGPPGTVLRWKAFQPLMRCHLRSEDIVGRKAEAEDHRKDDQTRIRPRTT